MKTLLALILLFSACRHAKKPETGVWDFSYLHDSDRTLYTFDTAVVTINKNGNIDTAWYFGYKADSVWKAWHKSKRPKSGPFTDRLPDCPDTGYHWETDGEIPIYNNHDPNMKLHQVFYRIKNGISYRDSSKRVELMAPTKFDDNGTYRYKNIATTTNGVVFEVCSCLVINRKTNDTVLKVFQTIPQETWTPQPFKYVDAWNRPKP